MIRLFFTFIATCLSFFVAGLLTATRANAEGHLLAQYRAWDVFYIEEGGFTGCYMQNDNRVGHSLTLSFWETGSIIVFLEFNVEFDLWFDEIKSVYLEAGPQWELPGAAHDGASIMFQFTYFEEASEFLIDVGKASWISLISPDDGRDVTAWNTSGFDGAFSEVTDCWRKLDD